MNLATDPGFDDRLAREYKITRIAQMLHGASHIARADIVDALRLIDFAWEIVAFERDFEMLASAERRKLDDAISQISDLYETLECAPDVEEAA